MDESPNTQGESPNPDNAAIPGDEPSGFDGTHGESRGLSDILADDDTQAPGDASHHETPGKRLIDHAEKLGLKPEQVYGLEVSLSEGKGVKTVAELKDIAQKAVDYEAANVELEQQRQAQDAKYTRMHGELRELIAAMPEAARTQKAFSEAARRFETKFADARKAADNAVDSWKDPEARKADKAKMSEFLKGYGFEDGYLEKVLDPRTLRLLRDASRLSARVNAAIEKMKKAGPGKKPNGQAPNRSTSSSAPQPKSSTPVSRRYDALLDS